VIQASKRLRCGGFLRMMLATLNMKSTVTMIAIIAPATLVAVAKCPNAFLKFDLKKKFRWKPFVKCQRIQVESVLQANSVSVNNQVEFNQVSRLNHSPMLNVK